MNTKDKVGLLCKKLEMCNASELEARRLMDNASIMLSTLLKEVEFQTKRADEFERVYNNIMKELIK
jgi:hypothetical protein